MKTLLPTLVLLGLVAALQAQDPLSLQPEEPNLIGTWYTKALVSNMTLPGPKTFQVVFPSTMTAREDGSLQARVTLMIMGQCHEKEILMQKTEEPGKYSSSGGAKLIYVEELSTKDHYILYCEKRGPKKMFGVGKLIGRTPEESPEALEEFRKFVQRKGLPQEKITIPEQRGTWYILRWIGTIPIPREKRREPLPPFSFVQNYNGKLEFRMHIRTYGIAFFHDKMNNQWMSMVMLFGAAAQCPSVRGWGPVRPRPDPSELPPPVPTCCPRRSLHIWLITPRTYGIAFFHDKMNNQWMSMVMLFGAAAQCPSGPFRRSREGCGRPFPPDGTPSITLVCVPAGRTLEDHPMALEMFRSLVENKKLNVSEIVVPPHVANKSHSWQPGFLALPPPPPPSLQSRQHTQVQILNTEKHEALPWALGLQLDLCETSLWDPGPWLDSSTRMKLLLLSLGSVLAYALQDRSEAPVQPGFQPKEVEGPWHTLELAATNRSAIVEGGSYRCFMIGARILGNGNLNVTYFQRNADGKCVKEFFIGEKTDTPGVYTFEYKGKNVLTFVAVGSDFAVMDFENNSLDLVVVELQARCPSLGS
ncbi:Odorant-binding protein 2b [Fukomys damarensis]|uniref:Odorant-binding protein 2b n=1 Tax=Fukomys damarensis TaxID=885580 RepID=A0A091CU43_FUKDA|nr:Odorant-binding protein 2b [Fukomys damarensis]